MRDLFGGEHDKRAASADDAGIDAIVSAMVRQLAPLLAAAGGEQHIHLHVDGRELAHVVAGQVRRSPELAEAIQRVPRAN